MLRGFSDVYPLYQNEYVYLSDEDTIVLSFGMPVISLTAISLPYLASTQCSLFFNAPTNAGVEVVIRNSHRYSSTTNFATSVRNFVPTPMP